MDISSIRTMAQHYGLKEVYHCSANNSISLESLSSTDSRSRFLITIWYEQAVVGIVMPHPRLKRIQSFHFGVTVSHLRDIFANPVLNRELNYVGGDWITYTPADVESPQSALRRQIAALDIESNHVAHEKLFLTKRLQQLSQANLPSEASVSGSQNPHQKLEGSENLEPELDATEVANSLVNLKSQKAALDLDIHRLEKQKAEHHADQYTTGSTALPFSADLTCQNHPIFQHQHASSMAPDANSLSSQMSRPAFKGLGLEAKNLDDTNAHAFPAYPSALEEYKRTDNHPAGGAKKSQPNHRPSDYSNDFANQPGTQQSSHSVQSLHNYHQKDSHYPSSARNTHGIVASEYDARQGQTGARGSAVAPHPEPREHASAYKQPPYQDPAKTFASTGLKPPLSLHTETPERYKGNRCLFSFANEDYQDEFGKSWSTKPVNCVALGEGYIIVYEDGGISWWDAPVSLDRKFRDEAIRLPAVQYVTLGPDGNYFIKFINGKMEWIAKASFQRAVKIGASEKALYVDKVALGANGSWVILWTDGSVVYEGVPKDLALQLDVIDQGPGLRDISLGPHGEWFAIFKDHSVQANNLPSPLHIALGKIKKSGGRVRNVVFGSSKSWYVRYWDGLA